MISQLYQEGKIGVTKLFFFIWGSFLVSTLGMWFFSSTPLRPYDLLVATVGGFVAASAAVAVVLILKKLGFIKKQ